MSDMAVELKQHRFNIEEYHRMVDAGAFDSSSRVELINGELVEPAAPMNKPHALAIAQTNILLVKSLSDRAHLCCQLPITMTANSEPLPDFSICRLESKSRPRHPLAEDVLWLIEIGESTRYSDRNIKVPLYASAGVSEVWLVDLIDEDVVVFREPRPDGRYDSVTSFKRGQTIAPLSFPDEHFPVSEILPPI